MRYLIKFRALDPDILVNEIKDYMRRNEIELDKKTLIDMRDSAQGTRTITGTILAVKNLSWRRKLEISIRVVGQMPGGITMITNASEKGGDTAVVDGFMKDFQDNLKLFFSEFVLEARSLAVQ